MYGDEIGSLGEDVLLLVNINTLNSVYVRLMGISLYTFFVSMFLSIRSTTPQLNFTRNNGLAMFLGSKNIEREQRCSLPSIL